MESSSSGRFHHYETPQKPPEKSESALAGGGGGQGEVNICEVPLPNVRLEEVARSEYVTSRHAVPPVGTDVRVREKLVGSRIAVEATRGGQTIGFLPIEKNYLLGCIKEGHEYKGKVTASGQSPTPRIIVDLHPA